MNRIICFFGRQGFGKSTLARIYTQNGGCLFHVGTFLKQPESYREYIKFEEIQYIKSIRSQIDATINAGSLCNFDKIDDIVFRTILMLSKDQDVFADGYPRTAEQAQMLVDAYENGEINLSAINLLYDLDDELQDYISFTRQFFRDLQQFNCEPMERVSRYRNKLFAYHTETEKALSLFIKHCIPICSVYLDSKMYPHNPLQFPFETIEDAVSGETYFGNEFFFYPANVHDYARLYKKKSLLCYPVMVTITLINKCTDNCVGCFNASYNTNECIDIERLEELIDDLADHGTICIKAAGREPTCYPYLDRFINKCHQRHLQCVIITSGANLDKWETVLQEKCDHLRVSLNAFSEESHKECHRPSNEAIPFTQRLAIVKRLAIERKKRNLTTGVTFLIRNDNERELPQLANFCRDCGVTYLRFSSMNYFQSNHVANNDFITQMEGLSTSSFTVKYHTQFQTKCFDIKDSRYTCPALLSRSVILANGDVVSCHGSHVLSTHGYTSVFGNINNSSFQDIWKGEKRIGFVKLMNDEMMKNYLKGGTYVCNGTDCCMNCKYAGFNHINRWISNHGENVVESYWKGMF